MDFIAALFAVSGSFLVTAQSRKIRLMGFIVFTVANLLWVSWALGGVVIWSLVAQSSIFLVSSILGVVLNWKEKTKYTQTATDVFHNAMVKDNIV